MLSQCELNILILLLSEIYPLLQCSTVAIQILSSMDVAKLVAFQGQRLTHTIRVEFIALWPGLVSLGCEEETVLNDGVLGSGQTVCKYAMQCQYDAGLSGGHRNHSGLCADGMISCWLQNCQRLLCWHL